MILPPHMPPVLIRKIQYICLITPTIGMVYRVCLPEHRCQPLNTVGQEIILTQAKPADMLFMETSKCFN